MMSATAHQNMASKYGFNTKFRRTSQQSKEVSNNFMVANRLKKALNVTNAKRCVTVNFYSNKIIVELLS